jgi:G3E family GTPase
MLWEDTLPNNATHTSFEIHRLKGRIPVTDGRVLLVQGVRNVYDTNEIKAKPDALSQEKAKLVLIGRGVNQADFRESLVGLLGSG